MPTAIATLIEHSSQELRGIINSPDVNASLSVQSELLKNIDRNFFRRHDLEFHIPKKENLPPHLNVYFNPFLAESLLRDGGLLLDRCLQQQREIFDLKTKWFETCLQIDELLRLNEITIEEESSYHLAIELEEKNLEVLKFQKKALLGSNESNQKVVDHIAANGPNLEKLSGTAAWASAFEVRNPGGNRPDEDIGYADFGIPAKKARDHTRDYAIASTKYEDKFRSLTLQEAIKRNNDEILVIDQKITAAQQSIELKKKQLEVQGEAGTQVRRNEIARLVAKRRADAKTQSDGPLNYKDRIDIIQKRFDDDLTAAWLRLSAAAKGFYVLYGYPVDEQVFRATIIDNGFDAYVPVKSIAIDTFDQTISFEQLYSWCQRMNTWLASFTDLQQQAIRSFSIRRILTSDEFEAGKDIDKGSALWTIKLSHDHFFNRRFVRMRNISLQTLSEGKAVNWNFALTPPSDASILRGDAFESYIDQSAVGKLFLGRVNDKTYTVVPELNSSPRLYNCSPIGFHTTHYPGFPDPVPAPPDPVHPQPNPVVGQPPPNRPPGANPGFPPGLIPPIPPEVIPRAPANRNPAELVRSHNYWSIEILPGTASADSIRALKDLDIHITVAMV